jgi:hypothetical protein
MSFPSNAIPDRRMVRKGVGKKLRLGALASPRPSAELQAGLKRFREQIAPTSAGFALGCSGGLDARCETFRAGEGRVIRCPAGLAFFCESVFRS